MLLMYECTKMANVYSSNADVSHLGMMIMSQKTDVATQSQLATRGERGPGDHCVYFSTVYVRVHVCYVYVCVSYAATRIYTLRASYKGILDKTRCTYDEMEFSAMWSRRKIKENVTRWLKS